MTCTVRFQIWKPNIRSFPDWLTPGKLYSELLLIGSFICCNYRDIQIKEVRISKSSLYNLPGVNQSGNDRMFGFQIWNLTVQVILAKRLLTLSVHFFKFWTLTAHFQKAEKHGLEGRTYVRLAWIVYFQNLQIFNAFFENTLKLSLK